MSKKLEQKKWRHRINYEIIYLLNIAIVTAMYISTSILMEGQAVQTVLVGLVSYAILGGCILRVKWAQRLAVVLSILSALACTWWLFAVAIFTNGMSGSYLPSGNELFGLVFYVPPAISAVLSLAASVHFYRAARKRG